MSIDKDKIDEEAEREGGFVDRHWKHGNMSGKGKKCGRGRGVLDMADESAEAYARTLIKPARPSNSFRKTGI